MNIARQVATRSTCDRAQVGCVVTQDNRIVATGYNASPQGLRHCNDVGHLIMNDSCIRAVHAEENAVISAAKNGISLNGGIAYITHFPCWRCARTMFGTGVQRIIFDKLKLNGMTKELWAEFPWSDKIVKSDISDWESDLKAMIE